MNDKHYFADVHLPFHVWVREGTGRGFRWVLRHAAEVHHGAGMQGVGSTGDSRAGGSAGGAGS